MLLSTIFETLTFGELSQHQLGGKKEGFIAVKDYAEVLSHLQLAITALCIRFPLLTKEVILREIADTTEYKLNSAFSDSVAGTPFPYIVDTIDNPFLDDVLQIVSIFNKDGEKRVYDDEMNDTSILMLSPDTLKFPVAVAGDLNYIEYKASLPQISIANDDPTGTIVDIPDVLMEPLCSWIGARILSFSNSQEQKNTSAFYFGKYEYRCAEIERRNILRTSTNNGNIKPHLRGYP